jgi:hypothetical protein
LYHLQFCIPGGRRVSRINEASQNSVIRKSFCVSFYCTISKQISCRCRVQILRSILWEKLGSLWTA